MVTGLDAFGLAYLTSAQVRAILQIDQDQLERIVRRGLLKRVNPGAGGNRYETAAVKRLLKHRPGTCYGCGSKDVRQRLFRAMPQDQTQPQSIKVRQCAKCGAVKIV